MKSTFALLAASLVAPVLGAAVIAERSYLDIVPLEARQDVSPEKYACHENCGNAITQGASGTAHCSDKTWNERFDYCMDCANEFGIWVHYGTGVTHAADACNMEINLKSNGTETVSTESTETTAAAASTPTDNAGSLLTSSGSVMLFGMIAAAGLL
ncbi:hypothetical protein F5X68DRAFT_260334 [Plectosphaerella plurivora]|uniref:Uncharacterized protein n=1 Tax=Plectosphaerella plurivora TaxID=936078 RepID=A0A9P8VF40_9PEZI|nr:hypothetical protein F5X68DRAFT_260334 [Plectosphaerella plurivora]